MKDKAQTISADAMIAMALFMMAIIFFFAMSNEDSGEKQVKNLQSENSKLVQALSGEKNASESFVTGSKVNERKLDELSKLNYASLKDAIGVDADFCIHFEDDSGNVINISGNKTGLGSPLISVGGVACG